MANLMKTVAMTAMVAVSATAQARTLALYPLNNDDVRNRLDLCDRVSGENLTSYDVAAAEGPGWTLPSNPSSDIPKRMALNYGAIGSSTAKLAKPLFHSDTAGAYLSATNDWTVEGFFRFKQLPNRTGITWNIIAGAIHGDDAKRWFVTLKYFEGAWHWHMMGKLHTEGKDIHSDVAMTDEQVGEYTSSWHHFAVTCRANYLKTGEKCTTIFYVDGEPVVSYERTAITTPYSTAPKNKRFDIGGLEASVDLRAHADFDYIRISDEALVPSQFLSADDTGRSVDTPTVGYWKLDASDDGTAIDPRPSVGATPVVGAAFHPTSGVEWANPIAGTPDQAFAGLPPNMNMLPTPTLRIANDGALLSAAGYNYLTAYGISSQVNFTNDFTVEGWMKPDHSAAFGSAAEKTQIIMATRTSSTVKGWALQWEWSEQNGWHISIFGSDDIHAAFINSVSLTGDLTDWSGEWKHFALVYRMGGGAHGRGLWSFYLDGALAGSAENQTAPAACTPDANMVIGGRNAVLNYRGALDYLRVSKAALAPPQFLNAANGMEATDVIALWPLNAGKGVHLDGRDAMGNYKLLWDANAARQVAASAEKPTVTNPDATLSFRGDPRTLRGSCDFAASTSSTLALRDADVKALAQSFNPMTYEFYVSRDGAPKNSLEFLLAWFSSVKFDAATSAMSFSYRNDKGFQVYDHMTGNNMNDTQFGGVPNLLAADGWHHVALTRDFANGKVIYELFIDGESKGTAQGTKANSVSASNVNALFLGGRYSSEHSLNGKMSSFRVSRGVLTPSEFLCAEGGAEPEPETIAYWKDESVGGRTFPVIGWYAQNGRAFTAEGRICWDGQDGVVAGTWDETCKTGWKLCIDSSSGTPALRLYGRTLYTSPFVDATLVADVSAWLGKWRYFALQYDPAIGFCGGWKFCLDSDTPSATVANVWDPGEALMTCPQPFTLGSGEDAFRKARLSSGVLTPSDLLFPKGVLLLFR